MENRKITFKQYNNALNALKDAGVPMSDDLRGFVAGLDSVAAICAGDFSTVPSELLNGVKAKKGDRVKKESKPQIKIDPDLVSGAAVLDIGPERVTGEILADTPQHELPAGLLDDINAVINEYCAKYAVDDMRKAPSAVWRGACYAVGNYLKNIKALHDVPQEREKGGTVYDAERVAALVDPYAALCAVNDKIPLLGDFCAFTGVSDSWIRDDCKKGLTSVRVDIYQKLIKMQEAGLVSALTDSRRNPTGPIFILKNHGWKDQREIIHTANNENGAAAAYPVFNSPQIGEK